MYRAEISGTEIPLRFIWIFFSVFLLTCYMSSYSQNNVNNQLWFDINPSYKLSKRAELISKAGIKIAFPNLWYKYYVSSEIDFSVPKLLFHDLNFEEAIYAGADLYFDDNVDQPNVIELSPYQGYTLKWPNHKLIVIKHKVELTERFQWDIETPDFSFGLQLSYEGEFTYKFPGKVWKDGNKIYLTGNIKFWWTLQKVNTFNNLARIMPGIGYEINELWKTAFLVGWKYTRDQPDAQFSNNNIIYRISVYYKIPKITK